jgi:hypothetical protein
MQFISRDPALSDAEESAYQYCGGEPVGKTDPSGLWRDDVHLTMTARWLLWPIGYYFSPAGARANARAIAHADERVDHGRNQGIDPFHGKGKKYAGTFSRLLRDAVGAWRKRKRASALSLLGQSLHTVQDHYAHTGRPEYKHRKGVESGLEMDSWGDATGTTHWRVFVATRCVARQFWRQARWHATAFGIAKSAGGAASPHVMV